MYYTYIVHTVLTCSKTRSTYIIDRRSVRFLVFSMIAGIPCHHIYHIYVHGITSTSFLKCGWKGAVAESVVDDTLYQTGADANDASRPTVVPTMTGLML